MIGSKSKYRELERAIGHRFRRKGMLEQALTHRSFRFENSDAEVDNERLEFLGDAVLGFLTAAYVYRVFGTRDEGTLTALRSRVTSGKALAAYAGELNLGEFLRMGLGEDRSGGRSRRSNLANAFEALVGAAYLDGGMRSAQRIFDKVIAPRIEVGDDDLMAENPKGGLQEYSQAQWKSSPVYRLVATSGPPHNTRFTVEVKLQNGMSACAVGRSKQDAESRAARQLLQQISEGSAA